MRHPQLTTARFLAAISCGAAALWGVACADPEPRPASPTLTDLTLRDADGEPVPLTRYRERAELLIVRVGTSWCGPCRWHAEHGSTLLSDAQAAHVAVLDVLLAGRDNAAPDAQDLREWSARTDGTTEVLADPDSQLSAWFGAAPVLPLILLVDSRTLAAVSTLSAPSAPEFAAAVASALKEKEPAAPALHDERFTQDEWALIQGMRLPPAPSVDPSNAYAELPAAVTLGKQLFFSGDLTPSERAVSCSSCHIPELSFQDGKDQPPEGVGIGSRNVPSIVLAPEQRWLFWDGRADSAWSQAFVPLEDPNEIGSSRLFVAHAVERHFAREYQAVFGALPELGHLPAEGKPGDAAWEALSDQDRANVNRVLVNLGKALAAYERSLWPLPNALDRYADGDSAALSDDEKAGLVGFMRAGCVQCHYGPRLTDDAFHNLRFPTGKPDRSADEGRLVILAELAQSEFLRSGAFSDAPLPAAVTAERPTLRGAFKTPGLRGVGFTLPYGHGGSFGGLASVVEAHRTQSVPEGSALAVGTREPFLPEFEAALVQPIARFLRVLDAELPATP